jgi:hypothetical protein
MLEGYSRKRTAVKKGTNLINIKNLQKRSNVLAIRYLIATLRIRFKTKKASSKRAGFN